MVISPDTENKSKNRIEFTISEPIIIPSTTKKIVVIIRPVDQIQLSPLNEPYAKITNTAEIAMMAYVPPLGVARLSCDRVKNR